MKKIVLAAILLSGPPALFALGKSERASAVARAHARMAEKKFDEASRSWEEALSSGAGARLLRDGLPLMGRCYEALENHQKALTAYQRALQFDEGNPDRLLDLARVYSHVELNREALELYKNALKKTRSRPDIALALAKLSLKVGDGPQARRYAEDYVRWEPRDPAGQRLLADIDALEGEWSASARRLDMLAAQDPSPEAYFSVGRLWMRAGVWDAAEAAFSRAEDLGFRTGVLYVHRGAAAWLKGDEAAARSFLNKALERYPGMGAAQFFMALLDRGPARQALARKAAAGAQGEFLKETARLLTGEKEK